MTAGPGGDNVNTDERAESELTSGVWIWQFLVTVVVLHTAIMAIRPMASYRTLSLGGDAGTVGLIAGAFGAISFVTALPVGRLADRHRPKQFIVAGAIVVLAAALLAAWSPSLPALALSQAVLGFGQILAIIGSQSLLAGRTPPARRTSWFAHYTFSASLGQFLGPAIASILIALLLADAPPGALVPEWVTSLTFLVAAVGAVAAVGLAISLRERRADHRDVTSGSPLEALSVVRLPGIRGALAASLAFLVATDVTIAYLPVYGTEQALPIAFIGLLLAGLTAAAMLSRLVLRYVIERLGTVRALSLGIWLPAAGLLLFPLVDSQPVQLLMIVMAGIGFGLGQPITLIAVATIAPPQIRASALSIRVASNRLGQFIAPTTAGWIAGATSLVGVFWMLGLVLAAAGLTVASPPVRAALAQTGGDAPAPPDGAEP